jgi:hypothetical protein
MAPVQPRPRHALSVLLMDIVKKIAYGFIVLLLIIAGIDTYGRLRDQYHIPGTKCYLQYNDVTLTVDLVYKQCPIIFTSMKTLLDDNIREVYWNNKKEIIAISYGVYSKTYYLLTCTPEYKGVLSPYEPYTIYSFKTREAMDQFMGEKGRLFYSSNHYLWKTPDTE